MTEKIFDLLGNFLKNNAIEGLDPKKITEDLPLEEVMAMLTGKDEYVVKRSGSIEKYKEDKLSRSIKNAADRAGMQLNSSDISIILKDIANRLFFGDDKRLTQTSDVRDIVIEILKKDGYSKIGDAYEAYAKSQR